MGKPAILAGRLPPYKRGMRETKMEEKNMREKKMEEKIRMILIFFSSIFSSRRIYLYLSPARL